MTLGTESELARDTSVTACYSDMTKRLLQVNGDLRMIHFGLWGPGVETEEDAQARSVHALVEGCGLGPGKRVLDAGCGLGGPAVALAREYGAQVTGLTICEPHIAEATEFAGRHGVDHLVEFRHGDFMEMPFPDASFDIVINHETFCYAPDKHAYLRGAIRVLKQGGFCRMAEGLLSGRPMSEPQKAVYAGVQRGWRIQPLVECQEALAMMEQTGFENIWERSLDAEVAPSTTGLSNWWKMRVFLTPPPKAEDLTYHEFMQATVGFDQGLREGVFTYRLISGTKPG